MPVEVKQLVIKSSVENQSPLQVSKEALAIDLEEEKQQLLQHVKRLMAAQQSELRKR